MYFLIEDEIKSIEKEGWKRWPKYITVDPGSETFEYLSFGGILYYRWAL